MATSEFGLERRHLRVYLVMLAAPSWLCLYALNFCRWGFLVHVQFINRLTCCTFDIKLLINYSCYNCLLHVCICNYFICQKSHLLNFFFWSVHLHICRTKYFYYVLMLKCYRHLLLFSHTVCKSIIHFIKNVKFCDQLQFIRCSCVENAVKLLSANVVKMLFWLTRYCPTV